MHMSTYVIAIGGNALAQNAGDLDRILREIAVAAVDFAVKGHHIVLVHGNGPQIGNLVIQNEAARPVIPENSMDECVAMTQAMIGYPLQQHIYNELQTRKSDLQVATIVTQVLVDRDKLEGLKPTKPIGPFYTKEQARQIAEETGMVMAEDSGRGYRRLVASPKPEGIVEIDTIRRLLDAGAIVISGGGGGIPVVRESDGSLQGVSAVIDKDFTAEQIACDTGADELLILTGEEYVSVNYGTPDQRALHQVTLQDLETYIEQGQFPEGSMLPKVQAAKRFVTHRQGGAAVIGSLTRIWDILDGTSGTRIQCG